jgi:hypothetical protein
MYQRKLS